MVVVMNVLRMDDLRSRYSIPDLRSWDILNNFILDIILPDCGWCRA